MRERRPWGLLAITFLSHASLSHGKVTDASVVKDGRQTILIDEAFGFTSTGHIEFEVADFRYIQEGQSKGSVDLSKLGFFINPIELEGKLELDLAQGACGLEANSVVKVLTMDQVQRDEEDNRNTTFYKAALADQVKAFKGGEYALFFENCVKLTMVTFELRVSLYNVDSKGNKDYLPVGEDNLPTLYMVMFVLFAALAAIWGLVIYKAGSQSLRVHYLMGVLIVAKTLTLLSLAGMYHLIRARGHPEGWNFAYYLFTFLRGILFFTVIVLVGTGWSYMKPLLAKNEKAILVVVIPLQVCAEVAIIVLDESTPASRSWFTWRDILHIIDIICCCAILFPIVWSINHLRKASETDGKAARNLAKLQLFQQFYVIVVSYVYFTRIVVYLLRSTLSYKYVWVANAAEELAALAFYCLVGLRFKPQSGSPYLEISQEDQGPL